MLRLKNEFVSNENGRILYRGELFSGILFSEVNCEITNVVEIKNGVLNKHYNSNLLPTIKDDVRKVNSECLEPEEGADEEPLCFDGVRFTGIAYDFDDEFCTGELIYTNGCISSQIGFYKSGVLESLELVEDDFSQEYEWYESGQLKFCEYFIRDICTVNLEFNENGEVTSISVNNDCFEKIESLEDRVKFRVFEKRNIYNKCMGARDVYISGSGIDDNFVTHIKNYGGFDFTSKLTLRKTLLTVDTILKLVSLTNLKELIVKSEELKLEDLQKAKTQRPDCYIEFNDEEVLS